VWTADRLPHQRTLFFRLYYEIILNASYVKGIVILDDARFINILFNFSKFCLGQV
jgi:hypothetical protein